MSEQNQKKQWMTVWSELSLLQAEEKVDELRQKLFQVRLNVRFNHSPSFSSDQRALKKEVARGLTYINKVK
jgi:ribosomal protein L29